MLSNFIDRVKSFYGRHFWDIMLVLLVVLTISGIIGISRLYIITPKKMPIQLELSQ